jgi:hypothetical protein
VRERLPDENGNLFMAPLCGNLRGNRLRSAKSWPKTFLANCNFVIARFMEPVKHRSNTVYETEPIEL